MLSVFLAVLIAGCAATPKEDWEEGRSKIEVQDWKEAMRINTVKSYTDFLAKHPDSDFSRSAKSKIEIMDWEEAKHINTVQSYTDFLGKHPDSDFSRSAESKIEVMDWEEAKRINTVQSYMDFLGKHADSDLTRDAKSKIEVLDWEETKRVDTIGAYEMFMRDYRRSEFTTDAKNRMKILTFRQLIRDLDSKMWDVRLKAVEALREIKDPRAVEPLIKALEDTHKDVRFKAVEALGEIKDSDAVRPLIDALRNKDGAVYWEAAEALGAIGEPGVEPLIDALLDSSLDDEWGIARVLEIIGTPEARSAVNNMNYWDGAMDRQLSHTANSYKSIIRGGNPDDISFLILALERYGTTDIATVFVNCGNELLAKSGMQWAHRHGHTVNALPSEVRWGEKIGRNRTIRHGQAPLKIKRSISKTSRPRLSDLVLQGSDS
jgi:hypothetical protein